MAFEHLLPSNYLNQISMTNPENTLDRDKDTWGSTSVEGGGAFFLPNYSDTPTWTTPLHQDDYTVLTLYCYLRTFAFDATMTWQLDYDVGGGVPETEWAAASSDNHDVLTSFSQVIADPSTQTIDDIIARVKVTQESGPPASWSLFLHVVFLLGEYAAEASPDRTYIIFTG